MAVAACVGGLAVQGGAQSLHAVGGLASRPTPPPTPALLRLPHSPPRPLPLRPPPCGAAELKSGVVARGLMEESEDNFNCHMKNVTLTYPDGKETNTSSLFVRGNQICFVVLPPLLQHAPMFRRVLLAKKGKSVGGGLGKGRQQAIQAKGEPRALPACVRGVWGCVRGGGV
jgi:small nuclear ribonucleoprotein D3